MNQKIPSNAVRCVVMAQKTTAVIDVTRIIAGLTHKFGDAPLVISAFGNMPATIAPHTIKMSEHLEPGINHTQNRAKARQLRSQIDSGKMLNVIYGHGKIVNKLYGKMVAGAIKAKKKIDASHRNGINAREIGLAFYDEHGRMIGIKKAQIAA